MLSGVSNSRHRSPPWSPSHKTWGRLTLPPTRRWPLSRLTPQPERRTAYTHAPKGCTEPSAYTIKARKAYYRIPQARNGIKGVSLFYGGGKKKKNNFIHSNCLLWSTKKSNCHNVLPRCRLQPTLKSLFLSAGRLPEPTLSRIWEETAESWGDTACFALRRTAPHPAVRHASRRARALASSERTGSLRCHAGVLHSQRRLRAAIYVFRVPPSAISVRPVYQSRLPSALTAEGCVSVESCTRPSFPLSPPCSPCCSCLQQANVQNGSTARLLQSQNASFLEIENYDRNVLFAGTCLRGKPGRHRIFFGGVLFKRVDKPLKGNSTSCRTCSNWGILIKTSCRWKLPPTHSQSRPP